MFYGKLFYALFISFSCYVSLNSMQGHAASIWVKNDTGNEIRATYQGIAMKVSTGFDIVAGRTGKIADNADDIALLKVVPYGTVRGKIWGRN